MRMYDVHALAPQYAVQTPRTSALQPPAATDNGNRKSFRLQLFAERAQIVQAHEEESALVPQLSGQPRRQHLRAADVQRVQQLTHGNGARTTAGAPRQNGSDVADQRLHPHATA